MILILFPYLFLKNVIFRHEFVHEFMREFAHKFVDEFFANFVHEFKYEIRMNFLHEKLVMLRNFRPVATMRQMRQLPHLKFPKKICFR